MRTRVTRTVTSANLIAVPLERADIKVMAHL